MTSQNRVQKLAEKRKNKEGGHPPDTLEFQFLSTTLLSIDDYVKACGISTDDYKAIQTTIRNMTLLYLEDGVTLEKQPSAGIEAIIKSTAEMHTWLLKYDDWWPARLYLKRYWRNRLGYCVHRKVTTPVARRRGRPPRRVEPTDNTTEIPKQTTPYSPLAITDSTQRPLRDSNNADQNSDTTTDVTSSEVDEKHDSDDEYREHGVSEHGMSFFERHILHRREKATQTLSNDRAPGDAAPLSAVDDVCHTREQEDSSRMPAAGSLVSPGAVPSEERSKVIETGRRLVKDFLRSIRPNLESHLEAFIRLGIRDRQTLEAFLAFPSSAQKEFVDEADSILQMTSLETRGLLVHCNMCRERRMLQSYC